MDCHQGTRARVHRQDLIDSEDGIVGGKGPLEARDERRIDRLADRCPLLSCAIGMAAEERTAASSIPEEPVNQAAVYSVRRAYGQPVPRRSHVSRKTASWDPRYQSRMLSSLAQEGKQPGPQARADGRGQPKAEGQEREGAEPGDALLDLSHPCLDGLQVLL